MNIMRMHLKMNYRAGDFWNTADDAHYEFICRQGLRDYCDVPARTKEIWACISDKRPRHNHWFRFCHNRSFLGTIVDFSDDELGPIEMDYDFEQWLIDSPLKYKYLWFEYEDKS